MFKFITKQQHDPAKGLEAPKGKSMTVPAMALSIDEVYRRYVAGSLGNIAKEAYFSNPENFEATVSHIRPDVDLSDLSDATRIFNELLEAEKAQGDGKGQNPDNGEAVNKVQPTAGGGEAAA